MSGTCFDDCASILIDGLRRGRRMFAYGGKADRRDQALQMLYNLCFHLVAARALEGAQVVTRLIGFDLGEWHRAAATRADGHNDSARGGNEFCHP